jgi:mycothiol synthase
MTGATYRPYRGPEDLAGMAAASARLRARLGLLDGVNLAAMEHHYAHLVNSDPLEDCLIAERDGITVGYSRVEWHDLADGDRIYDSTTIVEPAAWGQGIAEAFLAWSEARLRVIAGTHARDRRCWHAAYADEGDDESVRALEGRGYEAVRWDAQMLRPDLLDLPPIDVPAGYAIRTPGQDELPAVFEVMVTAFGEHWGEYDAGDQRFDDWAGDPRFRRDLVAVAWQGDTPVACLSNFLEPAPDGTVRGYLESLATHPDHRRRGLGRAAMAESLRLLHEAGATSAWLGVDMENRNQALTLYEACGFRVVTRSANYRKPFEPGRDPR